MSMPILERILRGGRVINASDPDMAKEVHNGIKRSVFFDIQVAADIAYERTRHRPLRIDGNVGLLHPPYPEIFMEWQIDGTPFGCYLAERDNLPITENGAQGSIIATLILADTRNITAYKTHRVICLDEASHFTDWGTLSEDEPDEVDIQMSNHLMHSVITALALINCRNVTTKNTSRINLSRSGRQKRRRQTPAEIRYQTIVLPGDGTQSDGKGGHRATALHRVRGHFKTFTANKPLLGKHIGTYWWGWQVRGNTEHGTIVSDYQLAGQP